MRDNSKINSQLFFLFLNMIPSPSNNVPTLIKKKNFYSNSCVFYQNPSLYHPSDRGHSLVESRSLNERSCLLFSLERPLIMVNTYKHINHTHTHKESGGKAGADKQRPRDRKTHKGWRVKEREEGRDVHKKKGREG